VRLEKLEARIRDESVALLMEDGSIERLRLRTAGGADALLDLVVRCLSQGGRPVDPDVALVARSIGGQAEGNYLLDVARLAACGPAVTAGNERESK
jgi:hypothetical protein